MGKLFSLLFQAIYLAYTGIVGKFDAAKEENTNAIGILNEQNAQAIARLQEQNAATQKEFVGVVSQSVSTLSSTVGESQKVVLEAVTSKMTEVADRIEKSNQTYIDKLSELFNLQEGYEAAEKFRIG